MFTRTITYTDFDGNTRKEEVRFHLSKSELVQMELGREGRMTNILKQIVDANDTPSLMREIRNLILTAYGVKSPDGKRFIKNDEVREEFEQSPMFDQIFMELVTDDEAAAKFVNELIPADLAKEAAKDPEYKKLLGDGVSDGNITPLA